VRDVDRASEFDRQVENLLAKGYPELAGFGEAELLRQVEPLRERLAALPPVEDPARLPFAIVVTGRLVGTEAAMARVELRGRPGMTRLEPVAPERFVPIADLDLPREAVYLVVDVDTGRDTLNVTPDEAHGRIRRAGRSALTIDEAIAVVTHFPEVLRTRHCFSILGSRCGDRRVPALWVSGGSPRLGWCWAGNPHTWLGSASCGGRAPAGARCSPAVGVAPSSPACVPSPSGRGTG
jgi:hypothetical protein